MSVVVASFIGLKGQSSGGEEEGGAVRPGGHSVQPGVFYVVSTSFFTAKTPFKCRKMSPALTYSFGGERKVFC